MLNVKKLLAKILNQQNDMIRIVHNVSLNSSGSIAAGRACAIVNTFVTNSIPDGYKLLAVVLRGTTNANFFCWYLDWTVTTNRVDYRVTNNGSSAAAVSPTVDLICVKLGGGYCVAVFSMLSALLRGGAGHVERQKAIGKNLKQATEYAEWGGPLIKYRASERKHLQRYFGHVQQTIRFDTGRRSWVNLIINRTRHGSSNGCGFQCDGNRIHIENFQFRYKRTFPSRELDGYGAVTPERGWLPC